MAWLPEDFQHPTRVELRTGQHLRPMAATDTEIDFPAVMPGFRSSSTFR
ncbi:MAG TPA: hypothetical protein VM684_07185 [Gaiellales bacterium]|nr:hypothetical protein [Gaiellales bacterium]